LKNRLLDVYLRFSPEVRIRVGFLSQMERQSVFQYDTGYIGRGLRLSPFHLPEKPGVLPYDGKGGMGTFGVFEDALPDGWGRRIIDTLFRRRYGRMPSLLERFACVGETGMGALTFHPGEPGESGADDDEGISASLDLAELAENAWAFDESRIEDVLPALRKAAGSSGGARPKVMIGYNPSTGAACANAPILPDGYEHWIVKFNTRADGIHAGAMEYAYNETARKAGADVPPCRLVETAAGRFFAVRRFDRAEGGRRIHLHSAAGLLHADFRVAGEEYATLFKLTDALTRDYQAKKELFRRAALNVLMNNRDDHLKNFAYLMSDKGEWTLSPLYDFTFSRGPNGWHTLSVAGEGERPAEADLLRLAADVSLAAKDAKEILEQVRSAAAGIPQRAKDLAR
jgi:serine/threonine-protein kinase HipA